MEHDITYYAKKRHTTKAYDADKKIPAETVEKLKELLRFSPSSVNSQPWHFIMASSPEGKERVTAGTDEKYPFNSPSIRNASHVVVFASRLHADDAFLNQLLEQEDKDGRYPTPENKEQTKGGRAFFVGLNQTTPEAEANWLAKQTYLNLGQFLLGAAALGLDATPMEGVDTEALDKEFGLREKGFASLAVVTVGYHDTEIDYNASLPKSRLPYSEILSEI
ncbi:oxygen-insensitive NAD(P)H-dependent nitroreductase NfsB [Hirschia maritima]|uniref:oxygen-insensitive NAD(P)H-dependent nitroreductase NfsB n=1 Tax=Hirschia maritima TaxID=1121961 RepID=UPI00036C80FB|nr:oxygen-insensitive NAD(P)H-dependent nitroreductase NfsB [Hirschia maritima]